MGIIAIMFTLIWFGVIVFRNTGKRRDKKEEALVYLPEEDKIAVEEFKYAKRRLKLYGTVNIYRDDMISRPGVNGIIRGKIVLPFKSYSKEELKVIYFHELMHYKHHDMFYKFCSMVAGKIVLSDKLASHRKKILDELCESHCDYSTIIALRGDMEAREYFSYVLSFAKRREKEVAETGTQCHIIDDSIQLWRRIHYFKEHKKIKPLHKVLSLCYVFLYVTISLALCYFIGNGLSMFNDFVYMGTENVEVIEEQSTLEPVFLSDINRETEIEIINMQKSVLNVSMDQGITENGEIVIEPKSRYILDDIYLEKGQHVSICALVIPSTEICGVGIIQEHDSNCAFVENKEFLINEYNAPEDGKYQIFIQNNGNELVTAHLNITYDD